MKLVQLPATDLSKFKSNVKKEGTPLPSLHRESLHVDGMTIALARSTKSDDPRTNSYSIEFSHAGINYVIIVQPTVQQIPAITLYRVHKAADPSSAEIAAYAIVKDTVTTLKAEVSGIHTKPAAQSANVANAFDLPTLLGNLKVK